MKPSSPGECRRACQELRRAVKVCNRQVDRSLRRDVRGPRRVDQICQVALGMRA
ncbi:hypothetical protein M407DRAFT_177838 [Tulasnella calospora MUT 4182]|uniref:Uncharacterized protein n=1 Tax=Tulasnella calospora MUT 4182 TaxID=1051891 RepID=A0A0C3QXI2_9AGAM|nr:hypothetical protein M407DRAFT_177838 [Tulasnella calospora MUT 4182]